MEEINNKFSFKSIKEWRNDDKPREKLLAKGPQFLSDSELLAILIREGTRNYSAIDLSKILLDKYNNLSELAKCDWSEFKTIKGIGEAKACILASLFELSKRIKTEPFSNLNTIKSPQNIADYYIPKLSGERKETFWTLLLNTANVIFREKIISEGILNATIIHPREVFRFAITESAASIILLHNHPSGNPMPSPEDIKITKELVNAGKIINIEVLDHIIIAGSSYTSLKQSGYM